MTFFEHAATPSDPEGSYCELPGASPGAITQPFILCVDDNEDNLLLASYVVELCGIEFVGQTSGWAALNLVAVSPPALILLDILLPDLNGIDFLNHLKQNPLTCDIPVIAVTALATLSDRSRLLLAGFVDYVSKPYMLEDLEATIFRHLKREG
jgi:CheY-like chemotaxis protein